MRNFDTLESNAVTHQRLNHLPILAWMLGIMGLSILIGLPLFEGKLLGAQDSFLCLIRIACVKKAWLEGQIFPRWASDMIFGYGYPILNFYQPFFHYLAGLLSFGTRNIIEAQNLASFLVYFASGASMFIFVASLWNRPAGFLSAAAYLFFPYHITDLYIRGAYTEVTAFAILPFLLWALKRLVETLKTSYMLALTAGVTLLSLSHNIMNMLFIPWLLMLSLSFIIVKKETRLELAIKIAVAFIFGLGSASFFLLPAILEQKYVTIEKACLGQYDYHLNFLTPAQWVNGIWNYKGPGQGPYQGVALELGIVHMILLLITFILVFRHWKKATASKIFLIFFGAMLLVSLLMTTEWSLSVWTALPTLKFVQFPYRFLVLTALALSVLVGFCVSSLRKTPTVIAITVSVALLAAVNIAYCRPLSMTAQPLVNNTLDVRAIPPGENGEFTSKSFKKLLWPRSPNPADIWQGEGAIVEHHALTSISHVLSIKAKTSVLICFNSFYFPGWTVQGQGKNIPIITDNPFGLIFFSLPPGEHHIKVFFQDTPVRKLTTLLSFLSLLGLLITVILLKRKFRSR